MTDVNNALSNQIMELNFQRFWKHLDSLFHTALGPLETRWLRIAGLLVKLECRNPTLLHYIDIQLACCFTNDTNEPDAVFRLWQGDIAACLRLNHLERQIHIVKDNVQTLIINEDKGRLYGFDKNNDTSYFCLQDCSHESITNLGYLIYQLLYNLAKQKGRFMLHGAALGYENKGVLICGGTGHGKSTLAISSLLQNCQYVADDHFMLTRNENITRAWPVYSIASLHESSLIQMPGLCLNKRWLKDNSKHVFDISAYGHQFCFGLTIKALIFPVLAPEEKKPSFTMIPAGRILTHLIWSTITQVNDRKDPKHIRNILDFLKDLPCYQLTLSSDIERNAKFLKKLILNKVK